ncbi:MAG: prolipoprotein diacylglyceryl transferase [Clostridia bacterium]|nr:prolipoprotein diacylglyceryl transferase [Clostridia bacterium]
MKPYITILERQIPIYGIFFYTGILIAATAALLICRRKKVAWYDVAYSAVYVMIGAILGAKLLFLAVSFRQIITEHIPFTAVLKGGFVFYGGLLGGVLGLLIYIKQFRMRMNELCEIYATVLPLGHAFGRVGCFFAGCCYGIPYDGRLSYTYHYSIGNTPTNTPLLPIQLIETMGLLLIFAILLIVYLKNREKADGTIVLLYLILYPILRFILEFFRGDMERGKYGWFSTSQWVSLALFCGVIIYLVCKKAISRKKQA